ncbi:MAG: hypothetical protein K0R15_618 [Clostridiales bacterium]|jgi:hypothetical protein|nr:hypothetical protein [Clostridiales bacterium]
MAEIQKGFNTQVEELKIKLATLINEAKLPATTIAFILQELTMQANNLKLQVLQQENQEFEKLVAANVDKSTSKEPKNNIKE